MRTISVLLGCACLAIIFTTDIYAQCCDYVVGDINGSGTPNGIDVTYAISFFKGGNPPPVDCGTPVGDCPQPSPFYAAGDVNGDCRFNGIDITYYVRFFPLRHCPSCPPCER